MYITGALVGGVNIGATAVTKIYYVTMSCCAVHEECDWVGERLINAKDYAGHEFKQWLDDVKRSYWIPPKVGRRKHLLKTEDEG